MLRYSSVAGFLTGRSSFVYFSTLILTLHQSLRIFHAVSGIDFAGVFSPHFAFPAQCHLNPSSLSQYVLSSRYCKDVRHFKPQYIKGLISGIQFNARCYDSSFPCLFSNAAIKTLFKGITLSVPILRLKGNLSRCLSSIKCCWFFVKERFLLI